MNGSDRGNGMSIGFGVVLVALGILFLVEQFFGFGVGPWLWPFFVIIPGLLFFVGMLLGGKSAGGLAIPGSIVTMVGLILLYQNSFDHFESWAYAWALIPVAVGIGMIIHGAWSGRPAAVQNGRRVLSVGLILFAIGFFFFELVLNLSGIAGGIVGPLLLVAGGLYLLWRNVSSRAAHVAPSPPPVEAARPVAAPPSAPPITEPRVAAEVTRPSEASPATGVEVVPPDELCDVELVEHEMSAHQ